MELSVCIHTYINIYIIYIDFAKLYVAVKTLISNNISVIFDLAILFAFAYFRITLIAHCVVCIR